MSIIQGHAKSSGVTSFYPTTIDQSLRFEDGDSAYLSRNATSGSRTTFTFSAWLKRGNLGSFTTFFSGLDTATVLDYMSFNTDGKVLISAFNGVDYIVTTKGLLRDPSAWYHIVIAFDSTQATSTNRVKIYINGEDQTDTTGSFPSLNYTTQINNNGKTQYIGQNTYNYWDGYLAEVHFTDGTAYTADAFGELKSGIWVPKAPSVTYGTNGFKLTFEDSAAIGDDTSGNGNDWTVNNLVASDVVLDSPTNNFCVWNAISTLTTGTLSEGNLSSTGAAIGTISATQNQSYWEITANAASVVGGVKNEAGTEHTTAIADTKTFGFRIDNSGDLDYINITDGGSWTNITTGLTGDWFPYAESGANTLNAGQVSFAATPPAGYLALSTANLPDPVIDPAQDATPEDHFNVVTYTGNETARSISVGFQPDFVWIKNRASASYWHQLYDSVRGALKGLFSNEPNAESTYTDTLTAFESDGFALGDDGTFTGSVNQTGVSYVSWNWKAGGTGVSNTDGSITSTVSANTDAGFSVVGYTGNGTAGATVGHGLSSVPEMIIVKNRDAADAWQVYHASNTANPETDYLVLNTTAATADNLNRWNDTAPTTSVFSLGDGVEVNTNTEDYIAYCFHSVDGFSRVGSYTGNGSTDGTFVYTGFRPAWVMYKRTNSTSNWTILDKSREGYNVDNDPLYPNLSNAEGTTDLADLVSNGFKLKTTDASVNASGGAYIYLAFAEQPFKYSNAR